LPSIKELTNKLKNYQSTKKITSAMKLVAASKLRRAQDATERTRPYRAELSGLLADLQASLQTLDVDPSISPWLAKREIRHISVVVFTSDKGLCGSFNNGMSRAVEKALGLRPMDLDPQQFPGLCELNAHIRRGVKVTVHFAGRKGYESLRSRIAPESMGENFHGVTAKPSLAESLRISDRLIEDYLSGKTDAIFLAGNRFVSPLPDPSGSADLPVRRDRCEGTRQVRPLRSRSGSRTFLADPPIHPLPRPQRAAGKRRR